MAYRITLTKGERDAIDWVGHRDWNGSDLYKLLWSESSQEPDDADWDDERDIECIVPEYVAWQIRDLWEENDCSIPHFAGRFATKLLDFILGIV